MTARRFLLVTVEASWFAFGVYLLLITLNTLFHYRNAAGAMEARQFSKKQKGPLDRSGWTDTPGQQRKVRWWGREQNTSLCSYLDGFSVDIYHACHWSLCTVCEAKRVFLSVP